MSSNRHLGAWSFGRKTASAGTAFTQLIPPWCGPKGSPPLMYSVDGAGKPNWLKGGSAVTVVNRLEYVVGATAHQLAILRPLNWAVVASDLAANGTALVLLTDPGAYSTAFKRPLPSGITKPASAANNAVAGSDYVCVQLKDGSWHLSVVTSVSSLTLTLTTAVPNVSGGGVTAGAICFFFGVVGDTDPATGAVQPNWTTSTSASQVFLNEGPAGIMSSVFPGDPLLFYSPNGTNAGELALVAGHYARP